MHPSPARRRSTITPVCDSSNVKVYCRIRPLNDKEGTLQSPCVTQMENSESIQLIVSVFL